MSAGGGEPTARARRDRPAIGAACVPRLAFLFLFACGYRPLHGSGSERLHVVLARSIVSDAIAADEVVDGARDVLAREGALAAGDGYPRVEIEILRADESSEGVAAAGGLPGGAPRARAAQVGIVARAWLVRAPGATPERDTGDVRALDLVAVDVSSAGIPDPRADLFEHEDALRAAARRLGARLAARVLGRPSSSDEGVGRER